MIISQSYKHLRSCEILNIARTTRKAALKPSIPVTLPNSAAFARLIFQYRWHCKKYSLITNIETQPIQDKIANVSYNQIWDY